MSSATIRTFLAGGPNPIGPGRSCVNQEAIPILRPERPSTENLGSLLLGNGQMLAQFWASSSEFIENSLRPAKVEAQTNRRVQGGGRMSSEEHELHPRGELTFRASNGQDVVAEGGGGPLRADRSNPLQWEMFDLGNVGHPRAELLSLYSGRRWPSVPTAANTSVLKAAGQERSWPIATHSEPGRYSPLVPDEVGSGVTGSPVTSRPLRGLRTAFRG